MGKSSENDKGFPMTQDKIRLPAARRAARSLAARAFVLAALALSSAALHAASDEATDEAFAALLSMPGAEPENGSWLFPVPEDFEQAFEQESEEESEEGAEQASEEEPEQEPEDVLIAYLAKKKAAGADFDAYRHFGTLLHHAIRAGLTKTAVWLLENGADPRKRLKSGNENAFGLSVRYKRDDLVQLLKNRYGLRNRYGFGTSKVVSSIERPDTFGFDPASPPAENLAESDIGVGSNISERTSQSVIQAATPDTGQSVQRHKKQWSDFFSRLPPGAYAKLINQVHSPEDLDRALADFPPEVLKRQADAALAALIMRMGMRIKDENNPRRIYSLPADSWRVLWRYTGRPLVYPEDLPLAGQIQPELWPELFASGYADHDAESALGCLLAEIGAADIEALWPQLEVHFPNLREAAPRMVLKRFRIPTGYTCISRVGEDEIRKKLVFLTSLGLEGPVEGIIKRQLENIPADLLAAMEAFLPDTAKTGSPSTPRLVWAEPKCAFSLDDDWFRELTRNETISENVPVEMAQLIDIPGEAECGLLLGGFVWNSSNPSDSWDGPYEDPRISCSDPVGGYEFMHKRLGKLELLHTELNNYEAYYDAAPGLTPVLDTATGRRYYLRDGGGGSMCSGSRKFPVLYEWKEPSKGLSLGKVTDQELDDALFEQCRFLDNDDLFCDGIDTEDERPADEFYGVKGYQDFLKTHGAARYDAYQAAILAFDEPKLSAMRRVGIPGNWSAEAIQRVGESTLPLEDKRKRIAWIFHDNEQLARSIRPGTFYDGEQTRPIQREVLTGLLDWLPREDWEPVLRVVSGDVRYLSAAARQKGLARLACDIDRAQGLICGGDWSVEE
jgi:hypothetical protein